MKSVKIRAVIGHGAFGIGGCFGGEYDPYSLEDNQHIKRLYAVACKRATDSYADVTFNKIEATDENKEMFKQEHFFEALITLTCENDDASDIEEEISDCTANIIKFTKYLDVDTVMIEITRPNGDCTGSTISKINMLLCEPILPNQPTIARQMFQPITYSKVYK